MMSILRKLEPRHYKKMTILVNELDENMEVVFIEKGQIMVGYEINKQKRYCLRYEDKCIIGAFGCTFNQRAQFIYLSKTESSGYSIRKSAWYEILSDNPEISSILKKNILMEHITQIRSKVLVKKKKAI